MFLDRARKRDTQMFDFVIFVLFCFSSILRGSCQERWVLACPGWQDLFFGVVLKVSEAAMIDFGGQGSACVGSRHK